MLGASGGERPFFVGSPPSSRRLPSDLRRFQSLLASFGKQSRGPLDTVQIFLFVFCFRTVSVAECPRLVPCP